MHKRMLEQIEEEEEEKKNVQMICLRTLLSRRIREKNVINVFFH